MRNALPVLMIAAFCLICPLELPAQEAKPGLQEQIDQLKAVQKRQEDMLQDQQRQLDESRQSLKEKIDAVDMGFKRADAADPNWDKPKALKDKGLINSYYFRFLVLGQGGWLNQPDAQDFGKFFDVNLPIYICVYFNAGENGLLKLKTQWGLGANLDSSIPTISMFNETYGSSTFLKATDVWYEHAWLNKRLKFRIGLVNLSSIFDQNDIADDETVFFTSAAWDNNIALEFPISWALSMVIIAKPTSEINLMVAASNANGVWNQFLKAVWTMGEVDYMPKPGGLQGNYRFYGWYSGRDHIDMMDPGVTHKNFGFGTSMDQRVNSFITLSLRYGWQYLQGQLYEVDLIPGSTSYGLVPTANHSIDLAIGFSGAPYKRSDDFIGLGFAVQITGDDWRRAAGNGSYVVPYRPGQVPGRNPMSPGNEYHIEAFYRASLTEFLTLTPDVQWVVNPMGNTYYNLGALVATLRLCLYIPG